MVGMRRVVGPKNPAELTYYVQLNGMPLPGTTAAKILSTVDSQTMALTLGYFVQLQAEGLLIFLFLPKVRTGLLPAVLIDNCHLRDST